MLRFSITSTVTAVALRVGAIATEEQYPGKRICWSSSYAGGGFDAVGNSPAKCRAIVRKDLERCRKQVRDTGIKAVGWVR